MAETKFSVMASLFTWMQKSKSSSVKRSKFRKFLDTFCRPKNGDDYFAAIRLILPTLDRERGSYGLREHVLATCLIDAIGMSRDSPDAQRLINWRKGGPKSGAFAGNFSLVAAEVLQRRQGMTSGGLAIKELNDLLDRLSTCEKRPDKTAILSDLIMKTNAQEMKWIIMIILKDLKLGISEKSIFHEFHPDAEDLFNVTCDLKLVCEKLRDRSQRHKRQDIEVGKAVRPQLAMRVSNAAAAWKKLHGKEVVVECKFDGDRIQIHKNGSNINFFSRNFLDHPEYEHGMSSVIRENVTGDRCILDGEMLVWDKSANRFADFGSNQEIAKGAKEGLESDRQLCYVAFDILYVGDTSVIHQTLKERHQLLQRVVKPIAGRLEILVPNGGLNAHRPAGEPCWSLIVHDVEGVERFFKETTENRDEGIVLKDLGSKWEPSDRSGKWLKLKPEYIRAGSDLDVLIIGGYYGSGRRGGEIAQFLIGLAERVSASAHPRRFVSFCRVGTGLSDEELDAVVTKLKPYLRKYEYPKKAPPSFYQVTNNSKERPDVWVESPEKSIIVSITSDIRTIRSEVFAAPYILRFPRIDRVRYDKPWHECLDVQSFVELVHSSNGTTQRAADDVMQDEKPKRKKVSRVDKKNLTAVPSHFVQTDVSQVKGNTKIFSNMVFYFVNVPSPHSRDSLHKMVAENGGTFSMNLNNTVTHSIASESKGIKFQAAKRHGDVIDYSWFFDCCSQKKLLPLLPKYFIFLSDKSKEKLQEEIDEFSDSYFMDINIVDLKQMLGTIRKAGDLKAIEYYKKKFSPKEEWIRFHGCCIYFHLLSGNMIWRVPVELAMRRMKVEISRLGGTVADTLSDATHLVVMSSTRADVDFDVLLSSFSGAEKRLLRSSRLQIVKSDWLEDSFLQNQKLPEDSYKLRPLGSEETLTEDSNEQDLIAPGEEYEVGDNIRNTESSSHKGGTKSKSMSDRPRVVSLPKREPSRKRGRPRKAQAVVNQPRRTRPRVARKPAKISEKESDNSGSSEDKADFGASSPNDKKSAVDETKGRVDFNKPQRKRAQIRNKHAVISGNESEKGSASSDEKTVKGDIEVDESNDVQMKEAEKYSRTSPVGEEVGAHAKYGSKMSLGEINEVGSGSKMPHAEQSKDTVDPIQAMFFSMIPSLARGKTVGANPIPEEFTSRGGDSTQKEVKLPPADPEMKPVKKKKVSYKDVANELLKDW